MSPPRSFSLALSRAARPLRIGIPDDEFRTEVLPGWEEPVALYFRVPGNRARYVYDPDAFDPAAVKFSSAARRLRALVERK